MLLKNNKKEIAWGYYFNSLKGKYRQALSTLPFQDGAAADSVINNALKNIIQI